MHPESRSISDLEAPLQAFKDYIGLKLHFQDNLVWHRKFSSRVSEETLLKRHDAAQFFRLADEERSREDGIQRLISLFKQNREAWIGDIWNEDQKDYHKKRLAVINSITYTFRLDIDKLVDYMQEQKIGIKQLFASDDQSPLIIRNQSDIIGGIKDETLALLERAFRFCRRSPTTDMLWERRSFMLTKYQYLVNIDADQYRQQLDKLIGGSPTRHSN